MVEEVEVIDSEKSAKDFLKSKRAISFLVWVILTLVIMPLLKIVVPELEFDMSLVVGKTTEIVEILIIGYSSQDVATALLNAVNALLSNKQEKEEV